VPRRKISWYSTKIRFGSSDWSAAPLVAEHHVAPVDGIRQGRVFGQFFQCGRRIVVIHPIILLSHFCAVAGAGTLESLSRTNSLEASLRGCQPARWNGRDCFTLAQETALDISTMGDTITPSSYCPVFYPPASPEEPMLMQLAAAVRGVVWTFLLSCGNSAR
jgi:hypothetical protein